MLEAALDGIGNPAALDPPAEAALALDRNRGRVEMTAESSEFLRISLAVLLTADALELCRVLEKDGALNDESRLDVEAEKELLTLSNFHCWPMPDDW